MCLPANEIPKKYEELKADEQASSCISARFSSYISNPRELSIQVTPPISSFAPLFHALTIIYICKSKCVLLSIWLLWLSFYACNDVKGFMQYLNKFHLPPTKCLQALDSSDNLLKQQFCFYSICIQLLHIGGSLAHTLFWTSSSWAAEQSLNNRATLK